MSSEPQRRARSRRGARRALLAGGAALLACASAAPAHAADATVHLTSVFASPIVATRDASSTATNNNYLCTPEPDGQKLYGTDGPFVAADGLDPSGASNQPSVADQQPALQAGASNDLCFGFTLTPDVEPTAIAGDFRVNDPVQPDVPATHVIDDATHQATDGDDMNRVEVEMPQGFLGDPDGNPQCTDAQFGTGNYLRSTCPAGTQVGTSFVRLTILASGTDDQGTFAHLAVGGGANATSTTSLTNGGLVYNLTHGPNELARLGVSVAPVSALAPAKFVVSLKAQPDGRLTTVVEGAPRRIFPKTNVEQDPAAPGYGQPIDPTRFQPMYVESLGIRAWGKKADHPSLTKDFAQWGTDCSTPLSASVGITTYGGVKSSASSTPFKLTGCDALPFLPSVSVETTQHKPGVPTGATITIGLGQTTSGPLSALLKDASVTLPPGLEIGAQAASRDGGLKLCSAAQFGKDSAADNTCPAGSEVGTVTVVSPLQSLPFVGKVYLGPQSGVGELPSLFLQLSPQGASSADAPRFKLAGSVVANADGSVTTTFKDAPQLRFSELKISFPESPTSLFSTPRSCGTFTSSSSFTSSASATPVSVPTSLTIDQECAVPAFAPSFSMVPQDATVGAKSPTTITLARPDRSAWLTNAKVSLPSGFLSDLNAATECPADAAAAGACPESSRIATVTSVAGVGDKPLTLTGQMYLAARQEGSVAGAVIVVHALIGDIDLGNVVVPARIDLRPTDAGLALTTAIPTRFHNLALNLRSITVDLDRPGFPLNPTACGPLRATAELTGDNGQVAAPTSDVTYTGCATRGLQPTMTASLTGETGPKGHPTVNVSITPRPGDTNLSATQVTLPAGLSADLPNVQTTCAPEQWNAGSCPAGTKVGSVSANVSITPDTITGDVYMVKIAGQTLPGLGMNFTGRYAQRVLGTVKIASTGRLITSFDSIPDLPLTKLNLTVAGGPKSPIVIAPTTCTADTDWQASFSGQGGQKYSTKLPVPCDKAPTPSLKWSAKTGLKLTLSAPAGKTLKSAKLTLPKGFKFTKSKSKQKKYVKVSLSGGKGKTKISGSSLSITAKGAGPKKVTITVKNGGFTAPKSYVSKGKLKKGKKIKISTRVVTSTGKVGSLSKTLKVG